MATMDDLSLDAATAGVQLLIQIAARAQGPVNANVFSPVALLMTSKNECNDISELNHARHVALHPRRRRPS
jgi:hypothetical protein